jgi:hypothetical protein
MWRRTMSDASEAREIVEEDNLSVDLMSIYPNPS